MKGWKGQSYRHSLASRGIRSNIPDYKKKMPKKIYHGTDEYSWNMIKMIGFREPIEFLKSKFANLGYAYGTTEEGWAEIYAEERAKRVGSKYGVILEIDVSGLPIEYDSTVALDSLMFQAFEVSLPIGPERVKLHKRIDFSEEVSKAIEEFERAQL